MSGRNLKYFAVNVKERRDSKGVTREQLAEKIDKNLLFVRDIENGRRIPKFEVVIAIAEALDVSIDELVSKPDRYPYNKD